MQEPISRLPVNRMRAVEEFDFRSVANPKFDVMPSDLGELPSDPFIRSNAVIMATFDHERARCHQRRQLGVVGNVAHVPFEDFVLARKESPVKR